MTSAADILVVGGYGVVGRRIAAHLAAAFPGRVVIAGRDEPRAISLCRELGLGTKPRHIDLDQPASIALALRNVNTVMTCVAQSRMDLLSMSIVRGLAYTDLAPELAFWQGAEELNVQAQQTGARIVLGAGLSPGISNMMASKLSAALGRIECIETSVLLSLGDEYGPDSLNYVLQAVKLPFVVLENGQRRSALPFSERRRVSFPEPYGLRTAYLFPWSDVVYYPQTLGVHTSLGRFSLDPAWAGRVVSLLMRAGARRWLEHPGFSKGNRRAIDCIKRAYPRRDGFALVVTASNAERTMSMSLTGRHQANVTAAGAAELTRALASEEITKAGVWLPEQIVSHERFFENLSALGWKPTTTTDQTQAVKPEQENGAQSKGENS